MYCFIVYVNNKDKNEKRKTEHIIKKKCKRKNELINEEPHEERRRKTNTGPGASSRKS